MRCAYVFVLGVSLLLIGCAPYAALKPKPELSAAEGGYLELTKVKNVFRLKKGKKYCVNFPGPREDNFYIILTISNKHSFNSFLVDHYKGKTLGAKIPDETPYPDSQSVYPVNQRATGYWWMADGIKQDMDLKVQYRYAPQWRYTFETKHAEYKDILEKNKVDRSVYQSIGSSFHFEGFHFAAAMDSVAKRSAALDSVRKQLRAIESIFPPSILNSSDKAYLDFQDLKKRFDDEIAFQDAYLATLKFLYQELKARGDVPRFMENVEDFIAYFSAKDRLAPNVLHETQRVLSAAFIDIMKRYDDRLASRTGAKPLDPESYCLTPLSRVPALYQAAGLTLPPEFDSMIKFVGAFDAAGRALWAAKDSLAKIRQTVQDAPQMPPNDFFPEIVAWITAVQAALPKPLAQEHGKYAAYQCAAALNAEIEKTAADVDTLAEQYAEAQRLVAQVNAICAQRDFRGAVGILKQNTHLEFLPKKYQKLDTLSIQQQAGNISESLRSLRWSEAESGLRELNGDKNFLFPERALELRDRNVSNLEDSLYIGIDRVSRARINKFLEENVNQLENIDSLYADSVFLPAYDVTFSSGSKRELIQRKNDLIAHLAKMKENEFPLRAITLLYDQFVKNPNDNGVLKARAVVAHGRRYAGNDEKIKRRIAECDPNQAKWITVPKEYRRLYALPVTDKPGGTNRYVFRVNIRIPSEAEFPVYDLNIKLPKELAQNAAQSQWYETITMNDKVIKQEGRVTISAPTPDNDYECQITPVSVNKSGNNYLEVVFSHKSFKVFIVSVMAQKPIIKKN